MIIQRACFFMEFLGNKNHARAVSLNLAPKSRSPGVLDHAGANCSAENHAPEKNAGLICIRRDAIFRKKCDLEMLLSSKTISLPDLVRLSLSSYFSTEE
jgi:hypothetical protein